MSADYIDYEELTVSDCVERARKCNHQMLHRSRANSFSTALPVYEHREERDRWMREARSIKNAAEGWRVLELRKTHKYVGTYRDLDEWEQVGKMRIAATSNKECDHEDDACEPWLHEHFIEVRVARGRKWQSNTINQALHDAFTAWGCHHEYDCCGCRSYMTSKVEYLGQNYWRVLVSSSRNY